MSPRAPDSRRYLMGRLPSYHGYADLPVIDDRFAFILPRFYQHTGRVVDMPGGMWELWSPNSRQTPYYPGVTPSSFLPMPPADITQRRYDGHLGCFDFCISPQTLSPDRPWHGFILRSAFGYQKRNECPEF
ncbi:hypothetical protein Hypma_000982 [Hypsizygus marmoreus]|uniref:Uncharacterized protein n=1 Tax=Hypsizygus marmoreus TaxID=39966 RepID=A0A369JG25_HYPMA|nr:hypothetical protein Hypma_000982 [Hypsizygus marmoreus]